MGITPFGTSLFAVMLSAGLVLAGPLRGPQVLPPPPAPTPQTVPELPPPAWSVAPSAIPITAAPPDSALVAGFSGHPQSLPLSCESRSAGDWAEYFGYTLGELAFFNDLPVSPNPDRGFVGSVRGAWGQVPPYAYGVHAGPVARLLQQKGVPAFFHLYTDWSMVQAEIAAGRPVMVWVTGHVEPGQGQIYVAPDGHRTVVAPFEHTVIVVGYDRETVTISDEGHEYRRFLTTFLESWTPLRNMAIMATP